MWKAAEQRAREKEEEPVWAFPSPSAAGEAAAAEGRPSPEFPEFCVLRVILHRKTTNRGIIDVEGVTEELRRRYRDGFEGCKVELNVTEWGTGKLVRPVDQIALLRHTDVYVSPAGSASFLGMFLPDGAGLVTMPQCAIPDYFMATHEWTDAINHYRYVMHEGPQLHSLTPYLLLSACLNSLLCSICRPAARDALLH